MSGAGTPLSAFSRFQDITGATYLTGPKEVINDACKNNYETLGYLLRGQQMSMTLQGGVRIKDNIRLTATRVTQSYLPGGSISSPQPQNTTTWVADWRYFDTPMGWTDQTVELNADASPEAKFQAYKNEWWMMQQEMWTDWTAYHEEVLWAVPNKTTMEAQDGQEMFSIPAGLNEHPNGLPVPGTVNGGTWATHQGIDPTAAGKANWKPTAVGYAQLLKAGTPNTGGLVSALDDAYMSIGFKPPPIKKEYFESPTAQPWGFVACSKVGLKNAKFAYRDENDRWDDFFDPFGSPTYAGRPFVYVSTLDTAAIYPTGSAAAMSTENDTAGTTNAGPRYFVIQPSYLRMVYHKDRFMKDLGVFTDGSTPTVHVTHIDTWGNLVFRSRRRHAIIYPTADITNA